MVSNSAMAIDQAACDGDRPRRARSRSTRVAGDELTGDVSDRQERCERQAMDRPAKVASDDEVQAMDQPTIGALPDVSSGSC
ncbi:hypothetical protein MANES_05G033601v8 [Manihot esculenta]|uniref:Uncharacterized protein n=1 Tax=Manihot esculenta TaxID=3983 RepID=A0ACB7HRS9_MANES|nr:hypothetical protein MANES_05G033601v8 [Manihot esculenta]